MKSLPAIVILMLSFAGLHYVAYGQPNKPSGNLTNQKSPPAKRKQGSPVDHLPSNIQLLTHFGERADFSPDNKRIAFMVKSFGDAMVYDIATRTIKCLTCNVPGGLSCV